MATSVGNRKKCVDFTWLFTFFVCLCTVWVLLFASSGNLLTIVIGMILRADTLTGGQARLHN